jgi:hypothetical protein
MKMFWLKEKNKKMVIKSKISQSFGPTGATSGMVFFGIGLISIFYTWKTVFLIIIGALLGFTKVYSFIDTEKRRVKLSEYYFGIIPIGKWIIVDSTMTLGYKMTNDGWSASSLSNRKLDIPDTRYTIILYNQNDIPIISLMKLKTEEEMNDKIELLATLLQIGF